MEQLGIEFLSWDNNELVLSMPVDKRTIQPMGILHGGASIALAETAGGAGSMILLKNCPEKMAVGLDIKANHIGTAKKGTVCAVARIRHEGKNTHVWDVEILNDKKEVISLCRVTNMIIDKPTSK